MSFLRVDFYRRKAQLVGHTGRVMDNQPVSFPDWKQALATAGLSAGAEAAYGREIITFLKHCKTLHAPATVMLAKQYVEKQERLRPGPVRVALRWFFRAARARSERGEDCPSPSPGVMGGAPQDSGRGARERAGPPGPSLAGEVARAPRAEADRDGGRVNGFADAAVQS
ncbi:MAG: hypothetical protein PSV13_16815 [Lacunisphaera sp.]|nr:hypothetical protein [Lacunisphaera sp.]